MCVVVVIFIVMLIAVFEELKLLRDELEQLTSRADAEAKCKIATAREQVFTVCCIC